MIRKCLNLPSPKTCILAFNTVVTLILEYASQVRCPHTKRFVDKLENFQRCAVKWVYKIPKYSSVPDIMGANKIRTPFSRREQLDLKFPVNTLL